MAIHLRTLSKIDAARPKRTVSIRSPARPDTDVPIYIPGEMEELAAERPVTLAKSVIDKVSGIALILLGLFVAPTLLVLGLVIQRLVTGDTPDFNIALMGLMCMGIYLAIACFRAAKNRLDTRRPVLLLRSHQDDGIKIKTDTIDRTRITWDLFMNPGRIQNSLPLETLLDEELRGYGPNVSLNETSR